jgi:coenzyme Q-binding protein COQ10
VHNRQIDVTLLSGPFRKLENRWRFIDAGHGAKRIEFEIDFVFKSRLLEGLLRANFHQAVDKLIGCFEARAHSLYGRSDAA